MNGILQIFRVKFDIKILLKLFKMPKCHLNKHKNHTYIGFNLQIFFFKLFP